MDNFLTLLEALNESNLPNDPETILQSKEVHLIVANATVLLIDDNGRNILENHKLLQEKGFHVFPFEKDRFGWISGCIQTKKGFILFG